MTTGVYRNVGQVSKSGSDKIKNPSSQDNSYVSPDGMVNYYGNAESIASIFPVHIGAVINYPNGTNADISNVANGDMFGILVNAGEAVTVDSVLYTNVGATPKIYRFIKLSDTIHKVSNESGVSAFLGLSDVIFNDFSGLANALIQVNSVESGLETIGTATIIQAAIDAEDTVIPTEKAVRDAIALAMDWPGVGVEQDTKAIKGSETIFRQRFQKSASHLASEVFTITDLSGVLRVEGEVSINGGAFVPPVFNDGTNVVHWQRSGTNITLSSTVATSRDGYDLLFYYTKTAV